RRVSVELRDAVDVGRDRGIRRARADAAEARLAELAGREVGEERVWRVYRRLADCRHAAVPQRVERNGREADGKSLRVGRLFLRRDGHRRQRHLSRRLTVALGRGPGWRHTDGTKRGEDDNRPGQQHAAHYATEIRFVRPRVRPGRLSPEGGSDERLKAE